MKRLLPIIIFICLISSLFLCLPKMNETQKEIKTLDVLNSSRVGVQTGVNYDLIVKKQYPNAEICLYSSFSALIPAVQQGKIDVYLTDSPSFPIEQKENPGLERIEEPLESVECNIGVTKHNNGDKILKQLNEYLKKIKENGVYDKLNDYWIKNYNPGKCTVDKSGITGENGVLRCTAEASYEPICMTGNNGELIGYDVDFIYHFCREYGYTPEIEPLEFDAMPAALASGKYDIATGLIKDDERSEEINFTDYYTKLDIIVAYNGASGKSIGFFDNLINSFKKTFIKEARWKMFGEGVLITVLISAASSILGTLFGLLLFLWCFHGKKAENKTTSAICWLIGSTPTVVLLMILYYVVFSKVIITNISVSIIGFTIIFGCSMYEIISSGVKAVGNGQLEAARAQGFSVNQSLFKIILPQAYMHFLPAYKSEIVSLIQESSIVGYIAVTDLTKMSDLVRGRTYDAFFPLIATALLYFAIIWLLTTIVNIISSKISTKNRKKEKILKGIKM